MVDVGERRQEPSGSECSFESQEFEFPQFGIRLHVLEPGQPNGLYHSESQQEAFLVLSGECTLLVEGEERLLRPWDFFHCPAGTEHIFVGAGDGPCVILMAGARSEDEQLLYPVSELAARYGASAEEETSDPSRRTRVRAVTAGAALVLGPPPLGLKPARCRLRTSQCPYRPRGGVFDVSPSHRDAPSVWSARSPRRFARGSARTSDTRVDHAPHEGGQG